MMQPNFLDPPALPDMTRIAAWRTRTFHACVPTAWLVPLAVLPAVLLAVALWPAAGLAAGRTEINQAVVDAAGGFPFTITEPGSYVLTSDLDVGADVSAIHIDTGIGNSGVSIDLNGFTIQGASSCTSTCPQGAADGVASALFRAPGSAVFGGTIRGFSRECVSLSAGGARVHDLFVSQCGRDGISVNVGSVVKDNVVVSTGRHGIVLGQDSVYAHNTVRGVDRGDSGGVGILGGGASAGNACEDGSCSRRGTRRYYLTPGQVAGNQALTACDPGFHTASIHEIWDYASLEYDARRGIQQPDSGAGPPAGLIALQPAGWARSGGQSLTFDFNREANCALWSSASSGDFGGVWKFRNAESSDPESERWHYSARTCDLLFHVWCVED